MYRMCSRCLMDTTSKDISFYDDGTCNFCNDFFHLIEATSSFDAVQREKNLSALVDEIKSRSKSSKYDVVVGVSGGVDSSYVLLKCIELGLRPLAVHMDNGWNDAIAVHNIAKLIEFTGVDYIANVQDWHAYDDSLLALVKADVVDLELLYDNAAFTTCYMYANKFGVSYILGGQNDSTEGIRMSSEWNWNKFDKRNMLKISSLFGNGGARNLTLTGTLGFFYYEYIKKIKWVNFLNFFEYDKSNVLSHLQEKFGYIPYPYKHYESILTRFYQGYILPKKFSIDKRLGHLSALVLTGQMSRDYALSLLKESPYDDPLTLERDLNYFCLRLDLSKSDFENYISSPRVDHAHYPSEVTLWRFLSNVKRLIF